MEYRVISADDYIDLRWMPKDLWSERLPRAWRERGPRVEETASGPAWVCDGQVWGAWGAYTAAQGSGVKMLNLLDEDRVMWASDYPHPASTWPFSQRVIEAQVVGLNPAVKGTILCENARALYGL